MPTTMAGQLGLIKRLRGRFVKTVLEENRKTWRLTGGVAEYRAAPVGAVGPVSRRCLAPVLLAQCFLILDSVLTHSTVQQQGHQEAGDNRQADLVLDGRHTGAPGLGLAEVVLPGVKTLLLLPAARVEEGDEPGFELELVGQKLHEMPTPAAEGDQAPVLPGTAQGDPQILEHPVLGRYGRHRQGLGRIDAQVGFHARDHGHAQALFPAIPERRVDESAVDQPQGTLLTGDGLQIGRASCRERV